MNIAYIQIWKWDAVGYRFWGEFCRYTEFGPYTSMGNLAGTYRNQGRCYGHDKEATWCRTSRHSHQYGKYSSHLQESGNVE